MGDGIRGTDEDVLETVCARLGIGYSKLEELMACLATIKPEQYGIKKLGGYPLFPRVINVNDRHACLALQYSKRSATYFTYAQLAEAFVINSKLRDFKPQVVENSDAIKMKKQARRHAK